MYKGEANFLKRREGGTENSEANDFEKDFKKKERSFYEGDIRYRDMIDFLEQGLSEEESSEEIKKKETLLNLFKGMAEQEKVNINSVRFRLSLSSVAENKGKDYRDLSQDDVQKAFNEYEKKGEVEREEKDAIKFYEDALENWSDTFYVDRQKIEALICDIKYRVAKRIENSDQRKIEMKKLKAEHINIADDIKEKGLRAEMQFVHLVNEWAERQGKGHLIEAYSALPLDDHKEKVDAEVVAGGKIFNVNLKSYRFSSDVDAFNERLLEKEERKIRNPKIDIAVLDSDEIQKVWRLIKEEKPTAPEKRIITKLMKNVIRSVKKGSLLEELSGSEQKEEPQERVTRNMIVEKHSNVPNLIRWGFLSEEGATDIEKIMQAKSDLKEGLQDKKVFQRIREEI